MVLPRPEDQAAGWCSICCLLTLGFLLAQDLKDILRIGGCETFRGTVDRPNLFYSVSGACTELLIQFYSRHLEWWLAFNQKRACVQLHDCSVLKPGMMPI